MIHDLENVKEMFKVADKMIQENPELLSMHIDTIFEELDDGTSEMSHNRWGIMTRAKMTEIKSLDNQGILDFLLSIKERNLLSEYIGYILQSEYHISLLDILLDSYVLGVHNEVLPFVESCLEYEEECFVDRIDEIIGIIETTENAHKFRLVHGYADLVIKKEKEEIFFERYLGNYSEVLEQLVSQLGSEIYPIRNAEAKKWLDIYIREDSKHCIKMGIHFLYRSLFNNNNAFEEYFYLLEERFCVIPEFWEILIPIYAQYLLNKDEGSYRNEVKSRLIDVKNGTLKEKRICVQAIYYRIKQVDEYIEILQNIIGVPFDKDDQILQGLDYYLEYLFSIDSSKTLNLLYELYEMNEYRNGDVFLEHLTQTCTEMKHKQDDFLNMWWDKFIYGNIAEFRLSVEIFSKVISLNKIDVLLQNKNVSREELLYLLEGIYLFTIEEKKIANLVFIISSYVKDNEFFAQYCIDNIFINYSGALLDEANRYIDSENVYQANLAKDIVKYYEMCKEKIQKGYEDRDFMPPMNRKIIYHKAMVTQNRKIFEQAEEQSVFANIFPCRKMKYGKRLAFIQTQRKGNYDYKVNEYARNSFSIELPRNYVNNPVKYVYMRLDYLERRGRDEVNC